MKDCTIAPTRFGLLCQPLLGLLDQAVLAHHTDFGFRKFKSKTHLLLTIYAHLMQIQSSRALIEALNDTELEEAQPGLRQLVDFDGVDGWGQPLALDQSNFSRANQNRSWRLWRYLAYQVLKLVRPHLNCHQLEGLQALKLNELLVVDGSLFDCLAHMKWATYRTTSNKIRLHFFYALDGTPDKLVLTSGKGSERSVLEEHLRSDFTYIFDRGYNDYDLYSTIIKARSHFVTRLLKNAVFEVVEEKPLTQDALELGLVQDHTILLGQNQARPLELRLITFRDLAGKRYQYLTSRFDLEALTIVRLYLYRWEVETFIGWFKAHLVFEHWYSHNENGVLIQLFAGFLTFLLLRYYQAKANRPEFGALRLENLRWLRRHLLGQVSASEKEAYTLNLPTAPPVHK
jgi:hypothetical protein